MAKFSSGLLNYVESVNINGYQKTVFYSEFATNFVVGDKVFIVNGNYDSNNLIQENLFTSETDGYSVLAIDRCRITLDIDYTGDLPFSSDNLDNYIKVYNVTSQREFDYINTLTMNSYNNIYSKFEWGLSNNIIFVSSSFNGGSSVIDTYSGIDSYLSPVPGFYQKLSSTGAWVNISINSIPFTTTGSPTYSLTNNNKLLIVGKDNITYNSQIFKSNGIYTFDTSLNKWVFDVTSNKAYISKLNFRHGKFNGVWNDGIFGTYLDQIDWDSLAAKWNSGIFINSNWKNGTINSKTNPSFETAPVSSFLNQAQFETKHIATQVKLSSVAVNSPRTINYNVENNSTNKLNINYYSKLNSNGLPQQISDYSNNNNYGFNYIVDSNIETGTITTGNFINCNLGLTSYGISALDVYYGLSFSYPLNIKGGFYQYNDINTVLINNSTIKNCNIYNSNITNTLLASNQIDSTVAQGNYNSDNGITVLNADLWSYLTSTSQKRGVLKLYISNQDLLRIQNFEIIFIDKINKQVYLFSDDDKVWLNIENKFIFDYFNNSELSSDPIIISRKNSNENLYKTTITTLDDIAFNTSYSLNGISNASIDIDLGSALAYYKNTSTNLITYLNPSPITLNTVSNLFSNILISNSNFETGLLVNSTWKNGDHINDLSNRILINSSNSLQISPLLGSTNSIYVNVSNNLFNKYDIFNVGDYVWLNGVDYTDPSGTVTTISSTFKVLYVDTTATTYRQLELIDINNVLGGLTLSVSGTFSVANNAPNYVSLNKFKISNSTINSGLFKTTLIENSIIKNDKFDNLDQLLNYDNISLLRFINTLVNKDNNSIESGYFYKSHIINAKWNNAIAYNSIWNGATFNNGIFNNSYWITGNFNNSYFVNSSAITSTTTSFDNLSYYRSWRNGNFNKGQFYKSVWIDGNFNNGNFISSNWYGGIWNNGILGVKNAPYSLTTMGLYPNLGVGATQTQWYNGVVESAIVGGSSSVYWQSGIFNGGEFTSNGNTAESIWYNGTFNGGKFSGLAKWKNGVFNNGKFISYYGWTLSNISHYSTNIYNAGYGFNIGDTFSIAGGDNSAYGEVTNIATASGLTIKVNTVGNITGSGFVFKALTVDSSGRILTSTASPRGSGYTVGELFTINNTYSVPEAYGRITSIDGTGGVLGWSLSFTGLSYTNSTTYSTTIYSGSNGPITYATIQTPGTGYLVNDEFRISGGSLASGIVTNVDSFGAVLSFTISYIGAGYTPSTIYNTSLVSSSLGHISSYNIISKGNNYLIGTYSTVSSSLGSNFIINILSLDTNIDIDNCAWENGTFNNGQFGLSNTGTNSVWYNGTFNGGQFSGRIWNNGVFTNGQFNGSSATSSFRNEVNFVNSYLNDYYGVWLDGYVVNQAHIGEPTQKVYTQILRATDTSKQTKIATLQNMLWLGGTFMHENGVIYNSVWLDGTFASGQFNNSSFNPFVDQNLAGSTTSLAFNFNTSCVWVNGQFNNSAFYISEWQDGIFNSGYMLGGIWRKGTWNYGTAENIYWESGRWRNGNWFGTNFDVNTINPYNLTIVDPLAQSVIYNIANATDTNTLHLINVFTGSSPEILYSSDMTNSLGWDTTSATDWYQSSTYSNTTYGLLGYSYFGGPLTTFSGTFIPFGYTPVYGYITTTVTAPNYKLIYTGNYSSIPTTISLSSNLLFGKQFSGGVYTTDIFNDFAAYTIKVSVHVDYPTDMPNPVYIDLWMGLTFSSFACVKGINTLTKSYTNAEVYSWTNGNTFPYTKFGIGKRSSNPLAEEVTVLSAKVNETLISYNPNYNNQLWNVYNTSPALSATLSLPTNITLTSDIGVSLNYGNGMFYSGVWENGIWENGYRNDDTLIYCDLYPVASYIKIDKVSHRVQLKVLANQNISMFKVGDYVSAGNLVGIDVSGNRKLLKDKFSVFYVDNSSIVLEYTLTAPIFQITKDSPNHLIYVTKNVWLSGAFLSGYFSGVWNYGLFKGYPYITEMQDSHWIDGIFDGGHFVSNTNTATYSNADIVTFNTGLVQNFTFKDNSNLNGNSLIYKSWIDVNYSTQSQVNLNRQTTILKTMPATSSYFYNMPNLYGSPTSDILSSDSNFRDNYSQAIRNYSLGWKLNKYTNFIPDNGAFLTPFSNNNPFVRFDNFTDLGYTYSLLGGKPINIDSNINSSSAELLSLYGKTNSGIFLFLNNTNIVPTKNRYYIAEMQLDGTPTASQIQFGNITNSFNHALTNTLTKTEYFYNNTGFNLTLGSAYQSGTYSIYLNISNLSYYEVDMIPFFQYATESNIDQGVYYPYTAVAPYIDYTNANYNYIGNIDILINPDSISNPNTVYSPANSGNIYVGSDLNQAQVDGTVVSRGASLP